ncbi:MAG: glycerate kinase [Planctomyces sp.]|nr:glycerate kinase [Planctomyces sp.]
MKSAAALRDDAIAIWKAGVTAVDSARLVREHLAIRGEKIIVAGESFDLKDLNRVIIVGAGKAGAGMSAAVEDVLEPALGDRLTGWVNVPEDCVQPRKRIHLHAARPAGVNEPTEEGVAGAKEILKLVRDAGERDLVLVLVSGGGSALLPAPVPGISLADKQDVTRYLAAAGAPIEELNLVRRTLSEIKGGGLARAAAGARAVISLIISDVIGDPLDVIASGPTVETHDSPQAALRVLEKRSSSGTQPPRAVVEWLTKAGSQSNERSSFPQQVQNVLIGTNEVALNAAATEATTRGYHVLSNGCNNAGDAAETGITLLNQLRALRTAEHAELPVCVLSGGEPTVMLAATDQPRRGGRNQELVLAALEASGKEGLEGIVLLSGGTDGEDGPTDAAGGFIDEAILQNARAKGLDVREYLEINNSYPFLEAVGGLLKTGPTHTNVMDLRVGLVDTP